MGKSVAPTMTVVVIGRDPGVAKCLKLVHALSLAVRDFVRIRVVVQLGEMNAVQIEDMGVVECLDEEPALEELVLKCSYAVRMRNGREFTCAAGIIT